MRPETRSVKIRCAQCRRTAVRDWGGLGPMPAKCSDCLRRNHCARNERSKKRVKAGLKGTAANGGWYRCSRCRDAFQTPFHRKDGSLCPECAACSVDKTRRRAREKAAAARAAEAQAPLVDGLSQGEVGRAPKNYYGKLPPSAKCAVCWRPVMKTMRTRAVCLDCLAKGER